MAQLAASSTVEAALARQQLVDTQLEYAGRAGAELAKALLVRDGIEVSNGCRATPAWMDPEQTEFALASGISVRLRIVDEERKLNLLWLLAPNSVIRGRWRERLTRLLDAYRADSSFDLDRRGAEQVVSGIEAWLHGRSRSGVPIPRSPDSNIAATARIWSDDVFAEPDSEEFATLPLGLDELAAVAGLSTESIDGFGQAGQWIPGLKEFVTVYTSLEALPGGGIAVREPYVWPFQKQQKGWQDAQAKRARERKERPPGARARTEGLVRIEHAAPVVRDALGPAAEDVVTGESHVFSIRVDVAAPRPGQGEQWCAAFETVIWRQAGMPLTRASLVTVVPLHRSVSQ